MWSFPRFYTRAFPFLIFVNDLSNSTKVPDRVLFADDTNLYCSDGKIRALFETVNQELSQINDWFFAINLFLNVQKKNTCFFINLQIKKISL